MRTSKSRHQTKEKNCLIAPSVFLAEHISATEDTERPNKLYHKGTMSHYDTDEPYGEEIVDIGTTFQDRAVTIKYRPRKIGRSRLSSDRVISPVLACEFYEI